MTKHSKLASRTLSSELFVPSQITCRQHRRCAPQHPRPESHEVVLSSPPERPPVTWRTNGEMARKILRSLSTPLQIVAGLWRHTSPPIADTDFDAQQLWL